MSITEQRTKQGHDQFQDEVADQSQERVVASLKVDADGQLVIPASVVDVVGLRPGDTVDIEHVLHGLLVVPVATEEEIEAFWGPNWRQMLDEANAEVGADKTTFYASDEEFLAALESLRRADVRLD